MKIKLLILMVLVSYPLMTWSENDHERAKKMVEQGDIISLQLILEKLQKMDSGRILEVELEYEDEHQSLVYEIELLSQQGNILEYIFDASTGKLLEIEKED